MSTRRILDSNGELIVRIINVLGTDAGNLKFYSEENELLQIATWHHPTNTTLASHTHLPLQRSTAGTTEAVYVVQGKLHMDIYDSCDQLLNEVDLVSGDLAISLQGGHGYKIIAPDTIVLEIKNGPYHGVDSDKRVFQNKCTKADA